MRILLAKILQKSLSMAREARKPASTWHRTACLCSLLCLVPEGVVRCGRAFSRPHAPGHLPLSVATPDRASQSLAARQARVCVFLDKLKTYAERRWTAGQGANAGRFRRQERREAVPEGASAQAVPKPMPLCAQPEGTQAAQDRSCRTASVMPMRASDTPRASQVARTPWQPRSRPGGRAKAPQRPRQNDAAHVVVKGQNGS